MMMGGEWVGGVRRVAVAVVRGECNTPREQVHADTTVGRYVGDRRGRRTPVRLAGPRASLTE